MSDGAGKGLDALDRQIAVRILRFLRDRIVTPDDPRCVGEALRGPVLGRFWTCRIGDHRTGAEIRDDAFAIRSVRIGDRKDVHGRRRRRMQVFSLDGCPHPAAARAWSCRTLLTGGAVPHTSRDRDLLLASSVLAREIAGLADADLLRLGALARCRARGLPGLEGADLLNEAVLRLLDGSRARPPGVPLVAVLAMTMRGVAHDHWRRIRRERPTLVPAAEDGDVERHPDASPGVDPERATAATQALADIDRLFARDAVALKVIAGLGDGLTPAEIRRRYGLTTTAYDTARRRMRRALLRRDGDGGAP